MLRLTRASVAAAKAVTAVDPPLRRAAASSGRVACARDDQRAAASSSAAASDDSNPLLNAHKVTGLPRFATVTADHVVPAVDASLRTFEKGLAALENDWASGRSIPGSSPAAAADLVDDLERLYDPISRVWGTVSHLNGVAQTEQLRDVYTSQQPRVVQAFTSMSQRVYPGLKSIATKQVGCAGGTALDGLDKARRRVVETNLLSAELDGAALPTAQREEFTALRVAIGNLGAAFQNNMLDSVTPKAFALDLTDAKDVDGMPVGVLQAAAAAASAGGAEGATAAAGPWRFTLDASSFVPFMQHCRNRALREDMYRRFVTRASSAPNDNVPIIRDILAKRRRLAAMLGYESYAAVSVATKMVGAPSEVVDLLERLRDKSYNKAHEELAAVRDVAAGEGEGDLQLWDVPFWTERQLEAEFNLSDDLLRPYFPLPVVLTGVFDLCSTLFGIRIESADGEAETWHPDVRYFRVVSADDGRPLAAFYLDPYARPGSKRGGAWMDTCVGRSEVLADGGSGVRLPVAYLVCNAAPPVDGGPPLMRFSEFETLVHELGHGLQHMLTHVGVGMAAGISGIEWDAVEIPSQAMENWCYAAPVLRACTRHVETGECLPDDLIESLRASRVHNAAMAMLRQLFLASLDMRLHLAPADAAAEAGDLDPFAVQKTVADRYALMKPLDDDRFLCSFAHVFAGGYAAGYYSYKLSECYSADSFTAFTDADPSLSDTAALAKVGARFRDTILGMGGSEHPKEVFKQFRGRDMREDALLDVYGLS